MQGPMPGGLDIRQQFICRPCKDFEDSEQCFPRVEAVGYDMGLLRAYRFADRSPHARAIIASGQQLWTTREPLRGKTQYL